jgi:hypothetical protein
MRTSIVSAGLALLVAAPLACSSTPEPVTPQNAAPPVATVAGQPPPASTSYDLSPVAEPADVVGVITWKSPGASAGNVASCSGVPTQLVDTGSKALVEEMVGEGLKGQADTKALAAIVAMDAPVFLVLKLDDQRKDHVQAAASVGLTSLEQAKGAIESAGALTELMPGVWRIGDKEAHHGQVCAIAASAGSTPARLVCAEHEKDVVALAPYLTRTAPTLAPAPSDLHAELRWAPIDARFGSTMRGWLKTAPALVQMQLSTGEPKLDRTVVEAATAVADEMGLIANDLDKMTFDLAFDPTNCLTSSTALQLRSKTSWLAGTIADRPDRAGPPPALFWHAPKDADSAFFGRAADPARFADINRTVRVLLDGLLAKQKIGSAADRKALTDLFDLKMSKDASTVSASGHVAASAKPGGKPQEMLDALVNGYVGWHLVGVDEGSDVFPKYVKDIVAVYGRTGLTAPIKKEMAKDAKYLPVIKTVAAPAPLGKGALDVEIAVNGIPAGDIDLIKNATRGKKDEKVSVSLHFLVMPDGKNTWMAFGANRDELVKRLLVVKSGAPDSATLASRPGLDSLRNGKNLTGGFMTLAPIAQTVGTGIGIASAAGGGPDLSQVLQTLLNLPNKGETPIFLTTNVTGGDRPRSELTVSVQKGSFEDLGTIAMLGVRLAGLLHP